MQNNEDWEGAAVGKVFGGRWERGDSLGEGGQGRVFHAYDRSHPGEGEYVLKVLGHAIQGARFEKEIEALSRLGSDVVPEIVDHGCEGELTWIVTKYLGRDLTIEVCERPLTTKEVTTVFQCISRAIAEAHVQAVVHRDIKPNNVVLRSDRTKAYLIDWGLGCVDGISSGITLEDRVVGNAAFAPPEGLPGGSREFKASSDVYSLGKLLYWLGSAGQAIFREALTRDKYESFFTSDTAVFRDWMWWLLGQAVRENPEARISSRMLSEYAADVCALASDLKAEQDNGLIRIIDTLGPRMVYSPGSGVTLQTHPGAVINAQAFSFRVDGKEKVRDLRVVVALRANVGTTVRVEVSGPLYDRPVGLEGQGLPGAKWGGETRIEPSTPGTLTFHVSDALLEPGGWYWMQVRPIDGDAAAWCNSPVRIEKSPGWPEAELRGGKWHVGVPNVFTKAIRITGKGALS